MRFDVKIKLVLIITERRNSGRLTAMLNENGYDYHDAMLAKGTARDEFTAYLGLGEPEKVIFTCFLDEARAKNLLQLLKSQLFSLKGGGMAFTLPVNSASNLEVARLAAGTNI